MTILRVLAGVLIVGWTTPILTVGIAGFGLPVPFAAVVAVAIAIALAIRLRARVMTILDAFVTDQSLFRPALWLTRFGGAAIVAIVFTTRLAVFMADPARVEYSLIPSDTWRVEHNCLSAYTEGARFAAAGDRNISMTPATICRSGLPVSESIRITIRLRSSCCLGSSASWRQISWRCNRSGSCCRRSFS